LTIENVPKVIVTPAVAATAAQIAGLYVSMRPMSATDYAKFVVDVAVALSGRC
jgi:hypothetical protein